MVTSMRAVRLSPRSLFQKYGMYLFFLVLFAFASIVSPQFLRLGNLRDVLNQVAPLGMVAIGQTFVILTGRGGIDLSVASVMASVAVIVAYMTGGQDANLLVALAVCIAFGLVVGGVNGLLVTKRRVPPFMATLGIMTIVQGFRFSLPRARRKVICHHFSGYWGRACSGQSRSQSSRSPHWR